LLESKRRDAQVEVEVEVEVEGDVDVRFSFECERSSSLIEWGSCGRSNIRVRSRGSLPVSSNRSLVIGLREGLGF
jgi:hypothetical protein